MSLWRRFRLWVALPCCLAFAPTVQAQGAQSQCSFSPLFQALHEAVPSDVGLCRGAELAEHNGDALQVTSKGLLLWRKDTNWTGFVGASKTVVMTADGPTSRLNTDRFDWELGGTSPDGGMFSEPASGLLPPAFLGPGFELAESTSNDMAASATISRQAQDRFRGARDVVQTVQVLPTADLAHSMFVDLGNLQQGDMVLKTTRLGDETQVIAWRPDDVSSFSAMFRQLALRARKSNAVVTVVLVPGTRLDTVVQYASMIFGRLR